MEKLGVIEWLPQKNVELEVWGGVESKRNVINNVGGKFSVHFIACSVNSPMPSDKNNNFWIKLTQL